MRTGRKENGSIPVDPVVKTTVRRWSRRVLLGDVPQRAGYDVVGVPKLPDTQIREAPQRDASRRAPIGCQNRFPNDEYAHFLVRKPSQKLFDRGGPPQTRGSSRRQKQHQAWGIVLGVKGLFKLAQVGAREG